MNTPRWLVRLTLTSWLLGFGLAATAMADERIVVLPFENTSGRQDYNWLGEGLALALSEWLSVPGIQVITPDERRTVYRWLSLPDTAMVSRASAIRIAQESGADLLVMGTYTVTGSKGREQVTLSVQSIDVRAGRLAQHPVAAGAPLAELIPLQGVVAWDILVSRKIPLTVSRSQFESRFSGIHPRTFELCAKAVLAQEESTKAELLQLALKQQDQAKSDTPFPPAIYELGKVYWSREDYAAAIPWLKQIKPGSLYYQDAQFYLGLCFWALGDLDHAISVYTELSRSMPTAGVFNNLAVSELKRRQLARAIGYLTVALAIDESHPDIWFNAGYAYWLNGDYEMAVTKFRGAVDRRVTDGEAHYLLAKSYEALGRSQLANVALETAKKSLPTVVQWERTGRLPMLARVVKQPDRLAWLRSLDTQPPNNSGSKLSALPAWLDRLLVAAERLIAQNTDREALALLEVVLRQAPDSARAHALKAQIHERNKEYTSAIAELRAATFWNPAWVAPYIRLANIHLILGEVEQARECVRKILALEPNHPQALALQDRLRQLPND